MHVVKQEVQTSKGNIQFFIITTPDGFEITLSNFGASIYKIKHQQNTLTLTPTDIESFLTSTSYFGKTVGRTCGRLSTPSFMIDDNAYAVEPFISKDAKLHGGKLGFGLRTFDVVSLTENEDDISIVMSLFSPHMEEGYPGNLQVKITYIVTSKNEIKIIHEGITDQDTLLNMNNHVYFNLGQPDEDVCQHLLYVDADRYVDVDESYQFKAIQSLQQLPIDFTSPRQIQDAVSFFKHQSFNGLDHVYLLNHKKEKQSILYHPVTHYAVSVHTTYPALVLYTYNYPSRETFDQKVYNTHHAGITLECQYEPDGIHHKALHDAILRVNDTYYHETVYHLYKEVKYEEI